MSGKKPTSQHPASVPSLSLVIPCYNEEGRLSNLFAAITPFFKQWKGAVEVVIVDDGSTDQTVKAIQNHPDFKDQEAIRLLPADKNLGKGGALALGVAEARHDFILTLDADMSTKPQELLHWKKEAGVFREDTIYIASREHKDSDVQAQTSRRIVGNVFNFLVRSLTPIRTRDSQCGFKLYPAAVAKTLFARLQVKGWAHDVELLYRAHLEGVKIQEMPVTWQEEAGSKINVMKDSVRMLFQILFISGLLRWQYFVQQPLQSLAGKFKPGPFSTEKGHPVFRLLFALVVLFLLFFMPAVSGDYGITGDERVQYYYGEHLLDYYESFGTDSTAQDCCPEAREGYRNLHYYGGFFDLLSAAVHHLFNFDDIWSTRHAMNSLFGWFAILFAGLLAKRFGGWPAAFVTVIVLALTPRFFGHSMNNPKDIPFAATFIFSLYYLFRVLEHLPRPGFRNLFLLAVGLALTIAIRIGGLLLVGFIGLFVLVEVFGQSKLKHRFSKDLPRYLIMGAAVIFGGFLGGVLLWPYAHIDPIGNPLEALGKMSQFETGIRLLFQGEYMMSTEVPWHYELTYGWITLPLLYLLGLGLSLVALIVGWLPRRRYGMVWFAAAFPLAWAIYQDSPLYDGMRHFLFVLPIGAVLAGTTWVALADHISVPRRGWVVAGLVALLAFLPLRWMVANHPHQVVYFNEIQGGTDAAVGKYETDYWYNSLKSTVNRLIKKEALHPGMDTLTIISNASFEVRTYFEQRQISVKVGYAKYAGEDNWLPGSNAKDRTNRRFRDWDYAIFVSRYMELDELINHWPPQQAYMTEEADGAVLNVVLKRTSENDVKGYAAYERQQWNRAIQLWEQYLDSHPNSAIIWYYLGKAYQNVGQTEKAIGAFRQSLQVRQDPIVEMLPLELANAYLQNGQSQDAINYINGQLTTLEAKYRALQQELQGQQQVDSGTFYEYLGYVQQLRNYYALLYQAYQKTGNQQGMQRAGQSANQFTKILQQYQQ